MTALTTTAPTSPSISAPTTQVVVVDLEMPFRSMCRFMIKWILASIPATAIFLCLGVPAIAQAHIASGSKVFIEPMQGGFNTYLQAALIKKHVPVTMVDDETKADYVIVGTAEMNKAGWAKTIFVSPKGDADASITVKDVKTGNIVYGYAVDKFSARHGQQSTAEACAKHFKTFIDKN
jgi:hypothetical protein